MIQFVNAGKTYPGGVVGLKNVSLTIDQGEFVAIIGLSGAGKSTLIRTVNRMIDVTQGQVLVDGVDVMTLKGRELRRFRRRIGMIFQSFNLVTRTTVVRNVLASRVPDMNFFSVLLGLHSRKREMEALSALDRVGILEKAYTCCDQLSGGQQQRVALPAPQPEPRHHPRRRAGRGAGPRHRAAGDERLQADQPGSEHRHPAQHPPRGPGAGLRRPRHGIRAVKSSLTGLPPR